MALVAMRTIETGADAATRTLLGRDRERELLNTLLDHVDEGGAAVVLRGERGIGKSSLLDATAVRAREHGFRVLAATGVQSEMQLPFAGLHQLLRPVLPRLDRLPHRQREAVSAAFGMTDAAAPDLFLIAMASLDLLSDIAHDEPVLVCADDAHWLDRPTSDVLSFVARRLASDRIVLLAAVRDGFENSLVHAGLPSIELIGLDSGAESTVQPPTAGFMLAGAQLARGLAALGEGKHADAFGHLRRVFDPVDPAHHPVIRTWAIGDLVEAAVQSGHRDEAGALVRELEPLAGVAASPFVRMTMAYARALLADGDSAEPHFRAALDASASRWPLYRARLELQYGTWLRRQRRVSESRSPLRAARDTFDALGAMPWSERARQELRASGERSGRQVAAAWDQLSPQELQVAQMAAEGMSNREIGQRLFLSHRTVGSHLYRAFPKLGVTSRGQLHATLAPISPAIGSETANPDWTSSG